MPSVTLIEKQTVANTNTTTFSAIPNTYKDLRLVWYGRTNVAGNFNGTILVRFNGNTSSIYNQQIWSGENTITPTMGLRSNQTSLLVGSGFPSADNNSSNRNPIDIYISEYANTSINKVGVTNSWGGGVSDSGNPTSGNPYNYVIAGSFTWSDQAAISSITVLTSSNLMSGTIHLYGIG